MLDKFPRQTHPNITMEENKNIESANQTEEVVAQEVATEAVVAEVEAPTEEVSVQPEVVAEPETVVKPEVKQTRRNGRNRSGIRKSASSVQQTTRESCGELENPSEFKEKLSGQNVSGYPEGEGNSEERPKRERRERGERKFRNRSEESVEASNEASEDKKESAEADENQHKGPSFESRGFTPRAVEVALSDNRPKDKLDPAVNDGVVSYTPEDNKCSISLFERIKTIIKSIFGKKEKSKKRYNKKGGKKNWNNNRDNGKRYNNRKNGGKGGYNKRRYNDRRPNGNGGNKNRQSGGEA